MNQQLQDYITTVAKSLRDLHGEYPTPEAIQLELADRCIDLAGRLERTRADRDELVAKSENLLQKLLNCGGLA